MTALFDPGRSLLVFAFVGEFSDEGEAAARAAVYDACAAIRHLFMPAVLVAGLDVTDTVFSGGGLWAYYNTDGSRQLCDEGSAGSWRERDPEAVDAPHAAARAIGAVRRTGRRNAALIVVCGDLANDATRNRARELAEEQWRAGCAARVEYVGEPSTCWIDLETTGVASNLHGVIEIGAVVCDSSSRKTRGQFEALLAIEPWMHVDRDALAVNRYDPERWARDAVPHDTGITLLRAWLPKRFTLACYNVGFDRGFLRAALKLATGDEFGWNAQAIDPLPMVRRQLMRARKTDGAKLVHAAKYFGIPTDLAHTALADAHIARLVYLALLGEDVNEHTRAVGLGGDES